jgi:hypothetical protein
MDGCCAEAVAVRAVARPVHYNAPSVDQLSLPLQILVRAAQHFASKARDGADVYVWWDAQAEEPFVEVWNKGARLEVRWYKDTGILEFVFKKSKEGQYFIKRLAIEADAAAASGIVAAVKEMVITALENLVIEVPPLLEELFPPKR